MFFVVLFLQLGSVTCHILPPTGSHLAIEELKYYRSNTTESDSEIPLQISDNFHLKFSHSPSITFHYSINLYMHDAEYNIWDEASVEESKGESHCGWFDRYRYQNICYRSVKLSKPLIGYDMLKPSGCDEEEFKKHPYTRGRWGYEYKEEDETACYMVVISTRGQSVSQVYPDNCVKQMQSTEENTNKNREKRNVATYNIITFKIIPGTGIYNFNCKFQLIQQGSSANLQRNVPNTLVNVYYRNDTSTPWDILLANISWDKYNNKGYNLYKSVVSRAHLKTQGVDVTKYFICAVQCNSILRTTGTVRAQTNKPEKNVMELDTVNSVQEF